MNRVCLEPTKFTDVRTGDETFGWRMYDNHGQTYNNGLGEGGIPDDDIALLRIVMESGDDISNDMIDFIVEYSTGLYIGDTWYAWEQIKHLWGGGNDT